MKSIRFVIASKYLLHRDQTTSENAAALKSLSNVEETTFEDVTTSQPLLKSYYKGES
jgi:hypothetical protein